MPLPRDVGGTARPGPEGDPVAETQAPAEGLPAWVRDILGDEPMMEAKSTVTASEHTGEHENSLSGYSWTPCPAGSWCLLASGLSKATGPRDQFSLLTQPLLPLHVQGKGRAQPALDNALQASQFLTPPLPIA